MESLELSFYKTSFKMKKLLLVLLCFCNLITLHYAYEGENIIERQAYNLNSLFTKSLNHLHISHSFKDEFPGALFDLRFRGFDSEQHGNLLQNTSKCADDLAYILVNFENQLALTMFDSFGKPESGILQGHFKWVGDYNECIQVHSTEPNSTAGNFQGKYCTLTSSLALVNLSLPVSFGIGICVPDSCSTADLQSVVEFSHVAGVIPSLNSTKPPKISIACKPTERHLNAPAKVVIALISLFCTLAVLGSSITAVKYFMRLIKSSKDSSLIVNIRESDHIIGDADSIQRKNYGNDDEPLLQDHESGSRTNAVLDKVQKLLECFCIFTNGEKLLNTDSSEGQLLCIHGIRFLSMSWVILGHSYLFCFSEMGNIAEAAELVNTFAFQVVLQGFYSVDSFFVLSGFLLAYLSMKEFAKTKGVINWPYFYVHRYIRLTPMYMVVLAFSATLYFYIGSGPYWPDGDYDPICREKWWWNLLYINNFNKQGAMCMGWSWYLANDMQFFVISPLFLICLWRWPKVGYGLLTIFLCASCFSNFFITYYYELPTGITDMMGREGVSNFADLTAKFTDYFNKIYIKPYTRIGPYLIGLLVGYFLFKRKASGKTKHSLAFICIGWIVATSVTLTCVYSLYHNVPSVLASSFYNALNRSCFAMGLSWVIYVCLSGQGGVVNRILSFKLFIPLSRLTYAAYLIHPMIINGYFSSLKTSFEFSHPTVVFIFLGVMLVTYGLALPVALVLESPIVSLEKLIRKSFSGKQSS